MTITFFLGTHKPGWLAKLWVGPGGTGTKAMGPGGTGTKATGALRGGSGVAAALPGVPQAPPALGAVQAGSPLLGGRVKAVVLASGGLDSTVLLAKLKAEGHQLLAFGVDYGQRHHRELESLYKVCVALGVKREVLYLEQAALLPKHHALAARSVAVHGDRVPDGHYTDASMKATVVPNRNMTLLALAANLAITEGCDTVAYACHAGDHTIYPDCRPDFADAMRTALHLCSDPGLQLWTPFVLKTKAEIVKLGAGINAPMHLTWSCYRGGKQHCGRCGTCTERRESFQLAGVPDPTEYEA